jgi:hypothetical protein
VAGSFEYEKEQPGFIRGWKLLDQLSDYQFLKDFVNFSENFR